MCTKKSLYAYKKNIIWNYQKKRYGKELVVVDVVVVVITVPK